MADYTYFMFDGVSSSKYNLYIQNNGEDLSYPSQPGFENQIVSPLYQGTNYLAGVNKKERTFSFNCWADSLNRDSVRAMLDWLSPDKVAELVLSYNPNYYYNVKLASITDFKHMAVNGDETSNYEFQLTFVTIGDFAAISRTDFVINTKANPVNATEALFLNPDNLAPTAIWDSTSSKFKLFNYASEPMYLTTKINNTTSFTIDKNDVAYYTYSKTAAANFVADSQYGFVKIGDNLAETYSDVIATKNLGAMSIESGRPETLYTTINGTPGATVTLNYTNHILENTDTTNLYMIIQDGDYGVELLTQEMTEAERQLYITESINEQYNKINRDGSNSEIDTLTFDTTPTTTGPLAEGQLRWNPADHTMDIGMAFGSTLQVGQESHIYVRNDGAPILEGDAVYVSGAQGQTLSVTKAIATSAQTAYVIAVATTPIARKGHGYVTTYGLVRGIDLNGWVEGTPLWLSSTVAGKYTTTPPAYNFAQSFIGWVAKEGKNGSVFVFPKYLERSSEIPLTDAANHFAATNVDGAFEELYQNKADKLFATNLVTNGDFSNGTTGWTGAGCTLSASSGALVATVDSQNLSYTNIITSPTQSFVAGRKYYLSTLINPFRTHAPAVWVAGLFTSPTTVSAGVSSRASWLITPTTPTATISFYVNGAETTGQSIGSQTTFDNAIIIDLTACFGAGKEPTLTEMDNMLSTFTNSWFNGTAELVSIANLAQLKADKTQEAWIAPTLLNGWVSVNEVGYMKDQFGWVNVRGSINTGTSGSVAFTLPTGYRPSAQFDTIGYDVNAAVGKIISVGTNGNVTIWGTYSGRVYLNQIRFKV